MSYTAVTGPTLPGMDSLPSPAQELVLIDRELARLDARRSWLLARRTWLLGVLRAEGALGSGRPGLGRCRAAGAAAWGSRPGGEASARGVRTLLLTLGGTLLAVAALAFTLVSWGALGIGGRTAVLSVVTVVALGVPVLLVRRSLAATAGGGGGAGAGADGAGRPGAVPRRGAVGVGRCGLHGDGGGAAERPVGRVRAGGAGLRHRAAAAVVLGQLPPVLAVVAFGGGGQAVARGRCWRRARPMRRWRCGARSAAVGATAWTAARVTFRVRAADGCRGVAARGCEARRAAAGGCRAASRSRGGSRVPGRWRARWWRRRRGRPRAGCCARWCPPRGCGPGTWCARRCRRSQRRAPVRRGGCRRGCGAGSCGPRTG